MFAELKKVRTFATANEKQHRQNLKVLNVFQCEKRAFSSSWFRASALQAEGRRFESVNAHHLLRPVAQLNRASDYGSEGYRFESCRSHQERVDTRVAKWGRL